MKQEPGVVLGQEGSEGNTLFQWHVWSFRVLAGALGTDPFYEKCAKLQVLGFTCVL